MIGKRRILMIFALGFVQAMLLATSNKSTAQFGGISPLAPRKPSQFDTLINIIHSTVAPDTWDLVGGTASILPVDAWGILIIETHPEIHFELEGLISSLRKARISQNGEEDNATVVEQSTPISMAIGRPEEVERLESQRQRLFSPVTIKFDNVPLSEALIRLGEKTMTPLKFERFALEYVDDFDRPITLDANGESLAGVLAKMLRRSGAWYYVDPDRIVISADACEYQITRIYLVKDLMLKFSPAVPDQEHGG